MRSVASLPVELEREALEACLGASNLRLACRSLLEVCTARLGLSRAAIVTRHGERVDGAAVGLPDDQLEGLLGVSPVSSAASVPAGAARGDVGDVSPNRDGACAGLSRIPFRTPSSEFTGDMWIDADAGTEVTALLEELLERSTTALARLAETDGLREELGRYGVEAGHLRKAFDSLPDPVIVLGEAGQVRLTNRRADELLMAGASDSVGRRRAVETNNLFFSAFRARAILGDGDLRELFLVDPRDGSDLLFEVEVLEDPSPAAHDLGSIFILRDITDLKRATTELEAEYKRSIAAEHRSRHETERLNVILANAGIPILVTDERSDIVLMNHEAEGLFEAPSEDAVDPSSDIRSNDAKITGLISDFLLEGGPRREVEVELREPMRPDPIPASVVLTKIVNRRDEPIAVVCVVHDQSEEREIKRLADELRKLNADLEVRIETATVELSERNRELEMKGQALAEASRMKTEFLAMMSHELRTPISSILGFNTLLKDEILGPLTRAQHETLEKMRSASDHLLSLINDVLDLSQVEAGKLTVQVQEFPIAPFVEELADTIRPMVRTRGLEFDLQFGEALPAVHADPTRLKQVVLNLVSNAVKFTEEGRITLRTRLSNDGERVRLEVEDTGVGIDEEHVEAIFEEFRQVDSFITRGHGGTGLGLAISRKLMNLMNGTLSVRSVLGEGSTFWIELPVGRG